MCLNRFRVCVSFCKKLKLLSSEKNNHETFLYSLRSSRLNTHAFSFPLIEFFFGFCLMLLRNSIRHEHKNEEVYRNFCLLITQKEL